MKLAELIFLELNGRIGSLNEAVKIGFIHSENIYLTSTICQNHINISI